MAGAQAVQRDSLRASSFTPFLRIESVISELAAFYSPLTLLTLWSVLLDFVSSGYSQKPFRITIHVNRE